MVNLPACAKDLPAQFVNICSIFSLVSVKSYFFDLPMRRAEPIYRSLAAIDLTPIISFNPSRISAGVPILEYTDGLSKFISCPERELKSSRTRGDAELLLDWLE